MKACLPNGGYNPVGIVDTSISLFWACTSMAVWASGEIYIIVKKSNHATICRYIHAYILLTSVFAAHKLLLNLATCRIIGNR